MLPVPLMSSVPLIPPVPLVPPIPTIENPVKKYVTMLNDPSFAEMFKIAETRGALQLAFMYLENVQKELVEQVKQFTEHNVIILSESDTSSPVRMLFTFNLIKHRLINRQQLEESTYDTLNENNVLILTESLDLTSDQSRKITEFVERGGLLLSFNTATTIIEKAFPNYIASKDGSTTVNKAISIEVTDNADKEIFSLFVPPNHKVTRLEGIRRFTVQNEEQIKVLVKEVVPTIIPLAVRWSYGSGTVYHMLLSHVVTKSFVEILPTKDSILNVLKNHINEKDELSESTKVAFTTATNCGFFTSVTLALAYQPFLVLLFKLILSHRSYSSMQ
eukprot:TRINITY_DN485_c0_g1_i2.p1 TRINITY_DN485_c0_g1~~TRINITY_DN485_c0_g1_i2.p1  ORF type:complete len:332 (-),score=45.36 TRINITY_DN485_c0_g1_i2:20-1015(-)